MSQAFLSDERCVDLLIQRATTGLGAAEAAELDALLARYPDADREAFEPAVAALTLGAGGARAPLPPALRARLLAQGLAVAPVASPAGRASRPRSAAPAWWAAAASIVVAIAAWYPHLAGPPPAPTPAELRARLLASGAAVVHWTLAATDDPGAAGAGGDVVFDPASGRGYLRLSHLAANDPRRNQYQLWIFDAARDDRYPVDGGVFDVPASTGEVIVPFRARLGVARPALFAVTIERPGGVVVSGREHIVVVAKPGSA